MAYSTIFSNSGSSGTPNVTVSGINAGDILMMAISFDAGSGNTVSAWPTGFDATRANGQSTLDGQQLWMSTKKAAGGETTLTATISTNTNWYAAIVVFTGEDPTTYVEVVSTANASSAGNTSPITVTANTMTTGNTSDQAWIGCVDNASSGATTSFSTISGYSKRLDVNNGSFSNLCIQTQDAVAPNTTGAVSSVCTLGTGTAGWIAFQIAFRNAAGGSTVIAPSVGAETYSGLTPSLSKELGVSEGSIVFGGNAPSVMSAIVLSPTEGFINFNGLSPLLSFQINPTNGSIVYSGNTPDMSGAERHFVRRHGRIYYTN